MQYLLRARVPCFLFLFVSLCLQRRRGYAYAEYASEAEASHAIATLNGKEVSGRTLVVEKSRVPEPRAERPARAPRAEAAAAGGAGAAAPAGEVRYHKDRIVVRNLPAKFDSDALLKVFGSEFKSTGTLMAQFAVAAVQRMAAGIRASTYFATA